MPNEEPLTSWRLGWNGRHFLDKIFKCFFLNEILVLYLNVKFVPEGQISQIPGSVSCYLAPKSAAVNQDNLKEYIMANSV